MQNRESIVNINSIDTLTEIELDLFVSSYLLKTLLYKS